MLHVELILAEVTNKIDVFIVIPLQHLAISRRHNETLLAKIMIRGNPPQPEFTGCLDGAGAEQQPLIDVNPPARQFA
jgi:hypothetical protein